MPVGAQQAAQPLDLWLELLPIQRPARLGLRGAARESAVSAFRYLDALLIAGRIERHPPSHNLSRRTVTRVCMQATDVLWTAWMPSAGQSAAGCRYTWRAPSPRGFWYRVSACAAHLAAEAPQRERAQRVIEVHGQRVHARVLRAGFQRGWRAPGRRSPRAGTSAAGRRTA